jgi:tetratricopeptide (TPR) repeat protein
VTASPDRISQQQALCERAPKAAGPRVILARLLLDAGRAAEAVAAAEMALALDPRRAEAKTVRDAAVQAIQALDPALAAQELSAALDPDNAKLQLDLGQTYAELGRPVDAERHYKQAISLAPNLAAARASLAALYLSVGIADGAEHHALGALALEPGQVVASQTLAAIFEARGEPDAAADHLNAAYSRRSLFVEPASDSQLTVLVLATQSSGNIPYRHLMPSRRYTRLVWYMEHAREDQFAQLPAFDLVFNTIGDPDLAGPSREPVRRFLATCARSVLNDPDKIARTHRDLTPALLGDLEGVVTPMAVRLTGPSNLVQAIAEAGLQAPVLVRPLGSHGGKGLERADTLAALAKLDGVYGGQDVYVTRYCDYRSPDGRYRKGRMIFVDRKPYPYHWAISDHWLVHYESAGMEGDVERQAEERRFLEDPAALIGEAAMAAIAKIGARLDLDYCGLDFSILPDGRVLVFEANATMLVHPEAEESELAYKNPAVTRIVDAFQARLKLAAAL